MKTNQEKKQTAVEWLIKELDLSNDYFTMKAINKAKQIEKEQREQDFIDGYKKRAEVSNLVFDEESELFAKSLFKENFKTK